MGATTPEGRIKKRLTEMLKRHKVWYFFPGNNGFGKSGLPDIIAIIRGRFVGIEVKADRTKKPTELQVQCGAKIQGAGGWWMVVCDQESLDMLDVVLQEKLYR